MRNADDRDTLLLGLVENVARENLSPVEEARAYASLIDEFELSLGEVAERVGRSKPSVSNRVRLLELPEDVLWMLARGDLTEGHARAVLALPDDDARRRLARKITEDGLRSAPRRRQLATAAPAASARPRPSTLPSPIARARPRTASRGCRPASATASSSSTSGTRRALRSWSRHSKHSSRFVHSPLPAGD